MKCFNEILCTLLFIDSSNLVKYENTMWKWEVWIWKKLKKKEELSIYIHTYKWLKFEHQWNDQQQIFKKILNISNLKTRIFLVMKIILYLNFCFIELVCLLDL